VIYVFEVRVEPGYTAEQYAEAWVRTSELIQQAPGARGTRLHRKIGEPDRLLAIASWDSKAARDAAGISANEEIQSIVRSQAPYVDISFIGEFEDPDWVVLPETAPADKFVP
jgi:heme-degrading monooxygenase HmoA